MRRVINESKGCLGKFFEDKFSLIVFTGMGFFACLTQTLGAMKKRADCFEKYKLKR